MVIFWRSLETITNSKNRTAQDFRVPSSYVTLFKGKNHTWNSAILILTGLCGRVNRVKLGFGFQQLKSSQIEPIFGTCVFVSIYCYFDHGFRVSAARITHFLYLKYQGLRFFELYLPKQPCEHIPQSFSSQLSHIQWRHMKVMHFFDFLNYLCPIWACFLWNQQEFAQNSKILLKVFCIKTTTDMRILDGLLFMWDVVPSFQNEFL
jgi:hypothetical protein